MRTVSTSECNSFEEVRKLLERAFGEIDDINFVIAPTKEARIKEMATADAKARVKAETKAKAEAETEAEAKKLTDAKAVIAQAKAVHKAEKATAAEKAKALVDAKKVVANAKKKGFITMKLLVFLVVFFSLFVGVAQGAWLINYDNVSNPQSLVNLLRDRFSNQTAETYTFTPGTEPVAAVRKEGMVYYDDNAKNLKLRTDAAWVDIDVSGASSLDAAYTIGQTITVDLGAVTFTAGSSDDNVVLALIQGDTNAGVAALTVTSAGNAAAILIAQSGSGTDIEGSAGWEISATGVGTFISFVLENSETIDNADDGEITFSDGVDDTAISWSGTTLEWTTDTSIDTVAWGDLDDHTGLRNVTFDAGEAGTITLAGTGTDDNLTIQQTTSGQNASLILQSTGTGTDALSLITTIADISLVSASDITRTAASNITDVTTDGAYTLTIGGASNGKLIVTAADTASITSVDNIDLAASAAGSVIDIDAALGKVIIDGGEAASDAVAIVAGAGGIDMDAVTGITMDISGASAGEDFVITTDSSIQLVQTEAVTDGINIDATGGVDIDSALDVAIDISAAASNFDVDVADGSIYLDAGEDDAQAIWLAATGTSSGVDIDAGTVGVDVDTSGPIVLTSTENAADSIVIQSTVGGIDIRCDASDDEAIDITNATGPININSTHDQDATINIVTTNAAGQILIVCADTTSDAVEMDISGGLEIDCVDVIAIDNSGAGKDIGITSALGRVVITGTESTAAAVELIADGTNGGIKMSALTNGIDMDATGGAILLDTSGASKDIKLDADSGAVIIDGGETGATAVVIDASHNDGGIDMDFGTSGFSLVGGSGDMVLTLAGNSGDVFTLTNTTGTGAAAISLIATAGSVNIDAKETITIDLDTGTAGTSLITITNADGTDEGAIELTSTSGGIDLNAAAGKNITLNGGQILIESEEATAAAVQLLTNTGAGETILITNTLGTGTGSIALAALAGGITMTVDDGKDLKLGNEGGETFIIVATNGTANAEDIRLVNGTGTDAAAIDLVATAGGIRVTVAEEKDLLLRGADAGATIVIATSTTAGNEDIRITNTNGTDEGAIELTATAGGIDLNAAAAKDIALDAGQILITATHDTTDCILLQADAGGSQTIRILNDEGTSVTEDAAAIQITTTLGGISIQSDSNLDDGIVLRVAGGTTAEMLLHNDTGDTATSIELKTDVGGVTIDVAKLVTLGGGTVHSGIQDVPQGGTSTVLVLTNTVFTVGADAGGDIMTIANGTAGQVIYIICEDSTGLTTITPTPFGGGTSITFDAVGDAVTLVYTTDTGWNIVGGNSYTII